MEPTHQKATAHPNKYF